MMQFIRYYYIIKPHLISELRNVTCHMGSHSFPVTQRKCAHRHTPP